MSERRRNLFVLLLVFGLLASSAAAILKKPTRLGLDLEGGVELVYQAKPTPQQPKLDAAAIDRALEIMRKRVDKLGVAEPEIQRSGKDQISVGLPDVDNADRAIKQVGKVAQLYFYDWEANVIGPEGKPDPTNQEVTDIPLTLFDAVKRASKRKAVVDKNNSTNAQFYLFSKKKKLIAGPVDTETELFEKLAGKKKPVGSQVFKINAGTTVVQAEERTSGKNTGRPDLWFVINDNVALNGTDIKDPRQEFDPQRANQPIVTMKFTDSGRKKFASVTKGLAQRGQDLPILPGQSVENNFQRFAIVLDNQLVSRPTIDFKENPDGIDGRQGAQISGSFKIQEAQDLAKFLEIGALPVKLELISQSQVSATLGKQALNQGLYAGIGGLILVALFLLIFYRVLGVIAVMALAAYAVYFYALIKLIPITLTLPGIAGLVLTIGVAADANIVIFERIKEEFRGGRSIAGAISIGYKKGFSTIVDANVVTLMTAFVLFVLATAGVKGFAFTLGMGTIVSLFTAVLATQAILGSMSRTSLIARPSALGAGEQKARWQFDYMGASKWFFSISGVILLVGALAIGGKGLNFGIDFESGTRIKTAFEKPATESQVRQVMSQSGFSDAKIQKVNEPELGKNVFQIATATLRPAQVQKVRQQLDAKFGVGSSFSNQSIGPTFGKTVANSALIAVIVSLLLITAYMALRFEWKFAIPVLIALFHDILITGGVYAFTGREVTTATVAALLTILGYSLYDTIIVFDRVRENVPRMPRAAFSQIVNRSMSEVLTRSLATSFCTLLPVAALLAFGGDTLKDFAFALLVGVASGAYSSIFIASPVLTHWKERESTYRQRVKGIRQQHGGLVPAYATGEAAKLLKEDDDSKKRASKRLTAPPEEGISSSEFNQLVADLHSDSPAVGGYMKTPQRSKSAEPAVEDDNIPESDTTKPDKPKRSRNRRHGRPR